MTTKKRYASTLLVATVAFGQIFAPASAEPKYKADVPESLLTPNTVETELLGTLDFFDGMPSDETVRKTMDFLDTSRAAEAFLTGMPATSIYAMLEGMKQAGAKPGDLVLWENYGDARTLALTFNTSTPYAFAEINVKDEPAIVEVPAGMLVVAVDDAFYSAVTRDFLPDSLYRGCAFHFRPASLSPQDQIERACAALGAVPERIAAQAWVTNRLPALRAGHAALVERLDRGLAGRRLGVTGNWFLGVSIEDALTRSRAEMARLFGS